MTRLRMRWAMIPGTIPTVHQQQEAITDYVEMCRDMHVLITSRPETRVTHGAYPVMTVEADTRPYTDAERKVMDNLQPHTPQKTTTREGRLPAWSRR